MPVLKSLGDPYTPERPIIKVIGCGGAGCNTLKDIPAIPNLETIGLNDARHPSLQGVKNIIQVKQEGLKAIALSSKKVSGKLYTPKEKEIAKQISGADMVYIVTGLGGEMGTWGSVVAAKVARKLSILSMALATMPFHVESERRRVVASKGAKILSRTADCLVLFSNDKLLKIAPDLPLTRAFSVMGQVMTSPILSFSRVITKGDKRVLREAFEGCREMRLGAGDGRPSDRVQKSVYEAFRSPWFEDVNVAKAKVAVVFVSSSEAFPEDLDEVAEEARSRMPKADIYYSGYKEEMGDRLRTVLLVGFG